MAVLPERTVWLSSRMGREPNGVPVWEGELGKWGDWGHDNSKPPALTHSTISSNSSWDTKLAATSNSCLVIIILIKLCLATVLQFS